MVSFDRSEVPTHTESVKGTVSRNGDRYEPIEQ
jgi:hypothetical protein